MWGARKIEWMRCLLDDLRTLGINADQWTTAAQDEGGWRRTAKLFMAERIAAEKVGAGLRHAVVCPNVTGTTGDRIAHSKRVRAGSLALVDKPQVARTFILRLFLFFFRCDVVFLWRDVFQFCFVFVALLY